MYPVSDTFLRALREAHTMVARVEAWHGGAQLLASVPFEDGMVTVNPGTGVRRKLDLTVSDGSRWDALTGTGVERRPYRGGRYPNGVEETVPLGVFLIDSESTSVAPGGGITVRAAPDRWASVQRARFKTPAASQVGLRTSDEVARLIRQAVDVDYVNLATSAATVGALVYERDREQSIVELLTAIGAEAYFDNTGQLIIADAPKLSAPPVWTIDASPTGVLLDGEQGRDRSRTYNVVVVNPAATDGTAPFAPQIAADTDPTSPTYVGGPFGEVPYFYASPSITTAAQALAAAKTLLVKVKAFNAQLSLEQIVNPALDRGDVVTAVPAPDRVERHLIDGITIPLTTTGDQAVTTRSSRPDGDVPAEE